MKIVIIPDIHNRIFEAEEIIEHSNPDKIIFLGDYFDSGDDTMEITHQTAKWLKDSLENPDRLHLLGNHDLSYLNTDYRCSGFSEAKLYTIRHAGVDLSKLQLYAWCGDWLCTHAGLSKTFLNHQSKLEDNEINQVTITGFLDSMINKNKNALYNCSNARGGWDESSGIVWNDYDEFVDIPNIKQIFGHTHNVEVRKSGNSYCIDAFMKRYVIYETKTNQMQIVRNE
jgi:predicted phosphodiesterase